MDNRQFEEFAQTMRQTLKIYGSDLSAGAIETWWRMLAGYPMDAVQAALQDHLANSVYPPKPADVIQRLQQADGRPGAEEAWSIAQGAGDENRTVVWTAEMASAFAAAQPLLAEGDQVGARMAFREAYEKRVEQARKHGQPVQWMVSLGHDRAGRLAPIQEAREAGRISPEQAMACLPAEDREEAAPDQGAIEHQPEPMSEAQRAENQRRLRELIAGTAAGRQAQ
jgi:hypothetical protein